MHPGSSLRQPGTPDLPVLSQADFDALAQIVRRETGIHMPSQKRALMQSRLAKRLRAGGFSDFARYRRHVESPDGEAEVAQMISALTTNVTRFFREGQHFDEMRREVLPDLVAAARAGRRVRLWSAGCSTGEEPYSLAMTVLSVFPDALQFDIRILATDIDPAVIATAAQGIYPEDRVAQVDKEMRDRFFIRSSATSGTREVAETLRGLVSFRILNLLRPWPFTGRFDIIMCRNVVIYFDQKTQAALWPRFAGVLARNGRLYIGHSERLSQPGLALFDPAGITSYRRNEKAVAALSGAE